MQDLAVRDETFRNASAQEAALPGWMQHYRPLAAEPFEGRVQAVATGRFAILRERTGTSILQDYRSPDGWIILSTTTWDGDAPLLDGSEARSGTVTAERGGAGHLYALRSPAEAAILMAETGWLQGTRAEVRLPRGASRLVGGGGAALVEWVRAVLATLGDGSARSADLGIVLPELLRDRLNDGLDALAGGEGEAPASLPTSYGRLFRRIDDCLRAEAGGVAGLGALSRALDAPEDALREAIRKVTGRAPARWLQLRRLDGAHRDLLAAEPGAATVCAIATHWGFWHLGRFAAAYARAYGETPAITLRAARRGRLPN